MKNFLLIALAATTMLSANAQLRAHKGDVKAVPVAAKVNGLFDNVQVKSAQKAEGVTKKGPKKVGANMAKYYRPQGTFYVNWDSEGGGYVMPFLQSKPYQELTFKNASTAPMAGSTWTYEFYNHDAGARETVTYEGQDLTYTWGYEADAAPTLTVPGVDSAYNCTQGARVNAQTLAITGGPYFGEIFSVVNSMEAFSDATSNLLANPHYYGSSNRAYNSGYGWTYYTGAADQDGGTSAYWFGRNWRGDFNAVATAVEKPAQPYVLNRVYGYVTALKGTAEFELTCRVYRLDEMPQYLEEDANDLDPEKFDDDHLIASGTTTVTTEMMTDGYAILPFDLETYDPDFDMNIQVTPEIDFPIMIVINGYDVPECEGLSFLITTDAEDEGWGEHAYMLATAEDGTIVRCLGLNNFFVNGSGFYNGMSIFMDVSMPFMLYNFQGEEGEYTFPNEGGSYKFAGQYEGVSIYGVDQNGENVSADNIYCSLEDGSDIPEWLTITFRDGTGSYAGAVDALVTAAALPAGTTYREANVKFYINGANLIYNFKQGEKGQSSYKVGDVNGDGEVDVKDINVIINIMLGTDSADNYEGRANVDGENEVDVADINAIINAMLGK